MMSLTKMNMAEVVKKQFLFKLQANIDSFSSLVWIQLLALLFSFGGVGMSGMGNGDLNVNIKYYTSDFIIAFTLIWSIVTSITITTKPFRYQDFSFITNRVSSSISNILFLITTSLLGAFTAILSGNLLKIIVYLFINQNIYRIDAGFNTFFMDLTMTFFYLLLVSSVGYFIGTLTQTSKVLIILIPVLFFGSLFLDTANQRVPFIVKIFQSFVYESSVFLFIVKTILTTAILFIISTNILNRLEVRR